jgi:hypothetical protein
MRFISFLLFNFFITTSTIATAQAQGSSVVQDDTRGDAHGIVLDAKTKETIIGASVKILGTPNGAITDFNGAFDLTNLPTGAHKIELSFTGYETQTITIHISALTPALVEVSLVETTQQVATVVVAATRRTNTEVAVLAETRKMDMIATGVSASQIQQTQDRDAAAVVKRIAGVTVTDDRFVNVRGLSERYNTVMLNDVIAPSTETDTRAFSFDMLNASAIDRMLVLKSGSADAPAEMAGGIIKIYTKSAAEENTTTLGIGTGFRAGTTFAQAQQYQGGKTDFLGFDDGTRSVLSALPSRTILNEDRNIANPFFKKLPAFYSVNTVTVAPDVRFNLGINRVINMGKQKLSTVSAFAYSNTNVIPQNAEQNRYEGTENETLGAQWTDVGLINNTRLSLMSNWTLQMNPKNKIVFSNLFNQLATNETLFRTGRNFADDIAYKNGAFRYEQKSIYSTQLNGSHELNEKHKMTWTAGVNTTNRTEPDYRRFTTSLVNEGKENAYYQMDVPTSTPSLTSSARFTAAMKEISITAAANDEVKISKITAENPYKIKVGVFSEYKSRAFDARWFGYTNPQYSQIIKDGAEAFYNPNNIGANGVTLYEGTNYDDAYTAQNLLTAAYANAVLPFTEKLNAVVGIRTEYNRMTLQSKLRGSGTKISVDNPILSLLPSVNVQYKLNKKHSVRAAYSTTVNRPEFREIAPFSYYDFNFNLSKTGNVNLKSCTIQNIDLKYEFAPTQGEQITVAGFYKHFDNPIEMVGRSAGSGVAFQYDNPVSAVSAGIEVEIRKNITKEFMFVANAAYIKSSVNASNLIGQIADRPLQGQAPYLINTGVYYNGKLFQANILYNIIGERIYTVGDLLGNETILEAPRHQLDFNISKTFNKHIEIKLGVNDILNQPFRFVSDIDNDSKISAADKTWRTYSKGTYGTFVLNYNF